jgi:hypothetical protein
MRSTRVWPTLTLFVAAFALMLSSCGGGDDSSKNAATTTGPTGTASATKPPAGATSGATGATGTTGSSRGKRSKGTGKRRGTGQSETPSSGGNSAKPKKRTGKRGEKKGKPKGDRGPGASPDFTTQESQLYRQSKVVCKGLGVDVLANQYHVKKNADDAAAAYADAYRKTFGKGTRDAVYRGCRSAFVG